MPRWYGYPLLLTLCVSLSVVSLALARHDRDQSTLPRMVATVTALDPRGLATLRAADGALYQVITGTGWRVGDTIACERYDRRTLFDEVQFDCRKVS
jgi:hypothetical protein